MVAGQVGEAIVLAVNPVARDINTDTEPVLILHPVTVDCHAVDLFPSHHYAMNSRVKVSCFSFLKLIYTFTYFQFRFYRYTLPNLYII